MTGKVRHLCCEKYASQRENEQFFLAIKKSLLVIIT